MGDGAYSLSMNGIANFALLYYTQVLGLGPKYAGLALSITIVWDALSDPVMGYITDNTRSRYGRRHPYILGGGLLLMFSFFVLWYVPGFLMGPVRLFWFLLVVNLLVRTAVTIFFIPYAALGFEICTDYDDRSKLQSVRFFIKQLANFSGGALAWTIFFRDEIAPDGTRIDGTRVVGNYQNMSLWLTLAIGVFIVASVYFTRGYASDSRNDDRLRIAFKAFVDDFRKTLLDRNAIYVFASMFLIQLGGMITAQIQIFAYVDFMQFSHGEKTVVHGAGMLSFAAGALLHAWLVKRFDKKPTAYLAIVVSVFGNAMLYAIFIGEVFTVPAGSVGPDSLPLLGGAGLSFPVLLFALFQGIWWGGMGMLAPLMFSMVADISEINYVETGRLRDGSYAAMFSFFLKAAMATGMLINGWLLEFSGYETNVPKQSSGVARNLATITFVAGPCFFAMMIPILRKYPIDRRFMQLIEERRSRMD